MSPRPSSAVRGQARRDGERAVVVNRFVYTVRMFPWMTPCRSGVKDGAKLRARAMIRELESRAATLYRLGWTAEAASRRLDALVAWEFDPQAKGGPHQRPASLDAAAIVALVRSVFDRHPS